MAWLRAVLILATTLAASRVATIPKKGLDGACASTGFAASCTHVNNMVRPDHVVHPLVGTAVVLLFTHAPTLFLSSRSRLKELWGGVWHIHCIAAALLVVSWLFLYNSRALSYALSLHFAALYLSLVRPPTRLLSSFTYRAVQTTAWVALLAYAWFVGPPLSVWDAPGIPSCCGAVAHVAAWIAAESLGRGLVGLEEWWAFSE
jgi:hypothetical protein